jgi:radical SAM superfamily enzyme YgiQ (UPF0313 family)
MKTLLINPGIGKYNDTPPINLAILAGYMESKGYEVKICDKLSGGIVEIDIENFKPDAVGITGTTPVIEDAFRVADYCKSLGIYTILGGIHTSIFPEESLKHADAIITGEGEIMLDELCQSRAKGIFKGKPIMDLDTLPLPSWHLLNMEFYVTVLSRSPINFMAFMPSDTRMGNLLTSRGCPWNCSFCYNSFRTLPARYNSAERVVKEIETLINNYHIDGMFFVEDNFFSNQKRVKDVCRLMKEKGISIPWGANSRVDCINEEILSIVKDANCRQITFGFESGCQKTLDNLNKKSTVELNRKAIRLCNQFGIKASGTFMIGNPDETAEDAQETLDFIDYNDILGPIGVCLTTPYPGTKIWELCKERGLLPENLCWDCLDFHHIPINMTKMSNEKLAEMYSKAVNIAMRKMSSNLG